MEERLMKKKKILMLVCMAVLAVTVVIPVNAAKKTNKKQIQVLNLYQDQKTDIEEAEYLVSYLEDKNIDEESVEKQEKEEWYIDIKTGKITKDSQYKRHFYNDGWPPPVPEPHSSASPEYTVRHVLQIYLMTSFVSSILTISTA